MEFENDLGKPWRWEEEDGVTVTRTCAWSPPGCHPVACGLKLYVKDGKLIKVEGDENQPITQGRLCVRCMDMLEQVYHPNRIIHPMKRAYEDRGKDKWEQITMDEAYAIIKEKHDYYKTTYGVQSMITFTGTGRQGGGMGGSAACKVLGTPNNCYCQSGQSCYGPRTTSTIFLMGQAYPEIDYAGGMVDRYDDPRFEVPKYIMLWGKAPLESNGDGFFGHAIIDLMKRGAEIISIDPRVNWIATRAKYHLRLRPGTDCALAMAMCNIIISEDLYDHEFMENWTYGFAEFAERVKTMSAEKAAEICMLDVEDIYEVTRAFATSRPSSICWGLAVDMSWNSVQTGQAIMGIMALTGNIDVPGGQILAAADDGIGAKGKFGGKGWDTMDPELIEKYQIGRKEYPMSTRNYQTQMDMTLDTLLTGEPYKLRMGWIYSTNPIACDGEEPGKWREGLCNLEFVMVTDLFMTPTAMACGDLFLPLAMFPEQDAVVSNHYCGTPTITGVINKAYSVGECKSDFEYTFELGKMLRPEAWEGQDTLEDWINAYGLWTLPVDFEYMREHVYYRRKVGYYKYETGELRADGEPGFETFTHRLELFSLVLQNYGEDPLPYYREPPMSPVSTPDQFEKYPFVLTTGARSYAYFHSEQRMVPMLREIEPEPVVEINPKVAERLDIRDGDWVKLENDWGKCRQRARVTWSVDEKTVMAQHGWWKPEEDGEEPHLFGSLAYNPNNLIPNHHIGKTGYGANIKSALCSVTKLTPAEVEAWK